jgi:hypothetical protein
MKCDSQASFLAYTLASLYFGHKPKARVTTRDYIIKALWWYWYRFQSPTIVKDGGSKVFLHRH